MIDAVDAIRTLFLFWDKLYIVYVAADDGAASFVYGVDKYDILTAEQKRIPWPAPCHAAFVSAPKAPIHMAEYERLEVIIQNRVAQLCNFMLTVSDLAGKSVAWNASVAPHGVHRFAFAAEDVTALDGSQALILRLDGLPTRYGRSLLFKQFAGSAFSAIHC